MCVCVCLEGHDAPTRSILSNHTINKGSFDTVDDVVARTRYEVAIAQNLNVLLDGERQASASEFGHDGKEEENMKKCNKEVRKNIKRGSEEIGITRTCRKQRVAYFAIVFFF